MLQKVNANLGLYDAALYTGHYWPVITYYYAKTWDEFHMPFHIHKSTEIMYIFMGQCSVYLYDLAGQLVEHPLQSGEFILVDANVPHRLHVPPGSCCYMMNIEWIFSEKKETMFTMKGLKQTCASFSEIVTRRKPVQRGVDFSGELYRAMNILQHTYLNLAQDPFKACVLDAEMSVFLIQLSSMLSKRRWCAGYPVHVKNAIHYIENKFCEPLNISRIADYVGIHPSHLQRLFSESVGITILQYLTNIRIEKAKLLLETEEKLSVSDVARLVGFSSRQHFTLCFKKHAMVTPHEYRDVQRRARMFDEQCIASSVPHYEL